MTATFHVGDAIEVMGKLPEKSVDLILTSPPFLALRSYLPADHPDKALEGGSQATPGAFIDWLVDVVEACDRILAPHGSMCIELGDTYAGSGEGGGDLTGSVKYPAGQCSTQGTARLAKEPNGPVDLVHPDSGPVERHGARPWPLAKSLSLIPELFRLTLVYGTNPLTGRTTERWRLRNVVRWVRPNPPVGALGDKFRPATSELMVFCKSAKRYFDLDAVREPYVKPNQVRAALHEYPKGNDPGNLKNNKGRLNGLGEFRAADSAGAPPLDWWNIPLLEGEEETRYGPKDYAPPRYERATVGKTVEAPTASHRMEVNTGSHPAGAPPLDWWNIPPGGYEGAHYAVFPPELCIKPIKAMCPEKVCRQCGEPSRRISEAGDTKRIAALIREGRERLGVDREDLVPLFIDHYKNAESVKAQVSNWELGKNMPSRRDWAILKARMHIDDDWDHLLPDRDSVDYLTDTGQALVRGERRVAYDRGGLPPVNANRIKANRIAPDFFSDCGHDDYRPGMVLDCFAGSGTTALVATGHGRDCILIDLDPRNFDLALDRVGPFILERGNL